MEIQSVINTVKALNNESLLASMQRLNKQEGIHTARLLVVLKEIDERKLYLEEGFSSLFSYCTEKLKYSESSAYRRISVARIIHEFPNILALVNDNKVSLSNLSLLTKHINTENQEELLYAACTLSKRDLEIFLFEKFNQDTKIEPRERVRVMKVRKIHKPEFKQNQESSLFSSQNSLEPVSESKEELKYELKFQVDQETFDNIKELELLLSNKNPKGIKLEDILKYATKNLLTKLSPKQKAKRREKRTKVITSQSVEAQHKSRHISAETKDKVYLRDKGQCSYVSPEGNRCSCKHNLQIDHIIPYAKGGTNSMENLRLLCAAHNQMMAEKEFGRDFMRGKRRVA